MIDPFVFLFSANFFQRSQLWILVKKYESKINEPTISVYKKVSQPLRGISFSEKNLKLVLAIEMILSNICATFIWVIMLISQIQLDSYQHGVNELCCITRDERFKCAWKFFAEYTKTSYKMYKRKRVAKFSCKRGGINVLGAIFDGSHCTLSVKLYLISFVQIRFQEARLTWFVTYGLLRDAILSWVTQPYTCDRGLISFFERAYVVP